jgi:hypothetical protein
MTGYEAFGIYQSLKLHFTQESYDYFKYNGKTNVNINTFDNRKDKYYYHKLSRKYPNREDFCNLMVANLLENENLWVADLLLEEAETTFKKQQKVLQSLSYIFENDCRNLFEGISNPNDIIKVEDGDYPTLLQKALRKDIQFETLCILANMLGFLPMWKSKIADSVRWPTVYRKMLKYAAFLPRDDVKYKLILRKVL